jgi:hypothetical protein
MDPGQAAGHLPHATAVAQVKDGEVKAAAHRTVGSVIGHARTNKPERPEVRVVVLVSAELDALVDREQACEGDRGPSVAVIPTRFPEDPSGWRGEDRLGPVRPLRKSGAIIPIVATLPSAANAAVLVFAANAAFHGR